MTAARHCPDSLIARAREQSLTTLEQSEVDAHASHCSACRVSLAVGLHFDHSAMAQSDDDLMAARLVDAVVRATEGDVRKPIHRSRRSVALWLTAAAVLLVSIAAAAVFSRKFSHGTHTQNAPARVAARVQAAVVAAPEESVPTQASSVHQPMPPIAIVSNETGAPTRSSSSHAHRSEHVNPVSTQQESSASLFALANASRRSGDERHARALYAQLQHDFPTSTEAVVSHVSLGKLLLERMGDARGALSQFDQYLAQRGQTDLMSEASFGRATALMHLGRASDERAAWRALLDRFPDSVYAVRARARLAELH